MGSDLGGNWRFGNDNGRAAAYSSLHIDTSKERMAFSDFPMPEAYPNFPHHSQVLAYFEAYAERFALRRLIRFRTSVESVVPGRGGGWQVAVRDLDSDRRETLGFGSVLVANGHHWDPRLPDLPGDFHGRILHSREYSSPRQLTDRRVLVIGIGNSGVDIACDAAHHADRTVLSTRRGAHVVPRFIFGRPVDQWTTPLGSRLPLALQRALYRLLLWLSRGSQSAYGVPEPATPLLSEHPTLSSQLLPLAANGEIVIKPDVERLCGRTVRFVDGSEEAIDLVICATGYRIRFPFLDPETLRVENNQIDLYQRVVHPELPGLYFIGLIQPLGAIMPLAELQARWVAGLLSGELALPDPETMRRASEKERRQLRSRYVESPRHTIQVDFFPYRRRLETEIQHGRRRALRLQGR